MGNNGYLRTVQVARLLGVCEQTLRRDAQEGTFPYQKGGGVGVPYKFQWSDVLDYWRGRMRGACLRCGILGEAEPDRGFMCEPCEWEERTGRIYPYPCIPRYRDRGVVRGRLAIDLTGGNGGPSHS